MILDAGGVALAVEIDGPAAGTPVVLVHGHSLDLRIWDDVVPGLRDAGLKVIRYDQRGHGRSGSPRAGYRWRDHVADLDAVITRCAGGAAHVVGLSKGAGIALEWAVSAPESVRSLTLVGPFIPDVRLSDELRGSFRELAGAMHGVGREPALRSLWLTHPFFAEAMAMPGVRERVEAMVMTFPASEYFAERERDERPVALADRLDGVSVNAAVVVGELDVPDIRAMSDLVVARLPHARRVIVPGCGHLVPLERPDAVVEAVLATVSA